MVLDGWFLPGAKPASSTTLRPVNGGGEVAINMGTASWMLLPAHDTVVESCFLRAQGRQCPGT